MGYAWNGKVYQDIEKDSGRYANYKTEAKVDMTMEGSQIIISPDKDATYDVISCDLK